jgi:hypothetical protein
MTDRLHDIAWDLQALADNRLLTTEARQNMKSAALLVRVLASYEDEFLDPRDLINAVRAVRNGQA